ncbi:MAG: histidine kinase [Betaproteobacteria bacterium]
MTILKSFKAWYSRLETNSLAKLAPGERADVLAFDASLRKQPLGYVAMAIGLWLAMAILGKTLLGNIGWLATLALSGVMLLSIIVAFTSAWFGPTRFKIGARSLLLLVGIILAGAVVGGLGANFAHMSTLASVKDQFMLVAPKILVGGLIAGMVYAVLMVSIVQYRRGQLLRRNEQLVRQAQQERMGRQLADARLKLMQAQVEPHFLFNTLASVQQLAENKAPEAAQLTAQLITFLRAGLASLREDNTTLAREFRAIDAYLKIMKTRMVDRLEFSLDLPDALRDIIVPPAMLISLVENAIKHGVEPNPDDSRVSVMARLENERLLLTVADTGLGIMQSASTAGGGFGLDNIRQRLRALYASQARLTVSENQPHGFIAVIDMPVQVDMEKSEIVARANLKGSEK